MTTGILDEAYQRLHRTGPEYRGWLSNHGPMTVEAMAQHGHGDKVHRWLDTYLGRLDELPRGVRPIDDWRAALGDPKRAGDWLRHFDRELAGQPWRTVLATWWPRLLPGIAAGATHGVIRVGHAVRALRDAETPARVTELGQALGYWASRWQPVPGAVAPAGRVPVRAALAEVPRIAVQDGGIRDRLPRLTGVPAWSPALAAPQAPDTPAEAERALAELIHQVTLDYPRYGHGEPVMLVHAVTAPTAVLRTLPELDPGQWAPSFAAAWAATAALIAVYAPPDPVVAPASPVDTPEEVFALAAGHGEAHVIKLADAVVDVHAATGDPAALVAAVHAARLI